MFGTFASVFILLLAVLRIVKYIFVEKYDPKPDVAEVSLREQNIIITGANTGLGFATAEALVKLGANIYLACRSQERAKIAVDRLKEVAKETKQHEAQVIEFLPLDLLNLASIRKFVAEFKALNIPLHVLINNAGVATMPEEHKDENISMDLMFAANCFGPFVLTELLMSELQKTRGRVVSVSSGAHTYLSEKDLSLFLEKDETTGQMKFNLNYCNLEVFKKYISGMKAYSFTKLCNVWQMYKWHRLYNASTGVTFNALHPGCVHTEMNRNVPFPLRQILELFFTFYFLTPEQGARTTVHVAASPQVVNKSVSGQYFEACKPTQTHRFAQMEEYQDMLYNQCKPFATA